MECAFTMKQPDLILTVPSKIVILNFKPRAGSLSPKLSPSTEKLTKHNMSGFYNPWIGVRQNKYVSDGSPILIDPPWFSSYRKINQCILYCSPSDQNFGKWCDYSCSNNFHSICEPTM